jgi:hypothetical protein
MGSFAEIKSNLYREEKILWEKRSFINELRDLKFTLNILILTVCISTFSILLYFLTTTINIDIMLSVIILATILIISSFPLYLFLKIYSEYKRIAKKLEIKLSELSRYEEFFILTNKRWIQKSFYLAKINDLEYARDNLTIQNDLAFVNLDNIKLIYVSPQKKGEIYKVNFFRLWDKNSEDSILQVFLEENDYQKLMETLRELFQITEEEQDVIKYGDCAFHCKKKK